MFGEEEGRYEINGNKVDLLEQPWDILVMLDACRYDYFEKYIDKSNVKGNLKKAISPATWTMEWLNKVFNGHYLDDVIYISANPFVNSERDVEFNGRWGDKRHFSGAEHFNDVINLWDYAWNYTSYTVLPEDVTTEAMKSIDLNPDMRHILHYMQPHEPYLSNPITEQIDGRELEKRTFFRRTILAVMELTKLLVGDRPIWKVASETGFLPEHGVGNIWIRGGEELLRKYYMDNLSKVMDNVEKLINMYPNKKILIVADHGEKLLEHGSYGHGGRRVKELIEVPWMEINYENDI